MCDYKVYLSRKSQTYVLNKVKAMSLRTVTSHLSLRRCILEKQTVSAEPAQLRYVPWPCITPTRLERNHSLQLTRYEHHLCGMLLFPLFLFHAVAKRAGVRNADRPNTETTVFALSGSARSGAEFVYTKMWALSGK